MADVKKLRAVEDLKWDACFEAAADASTAGLVGSNIEMLSRRQIIRTVQAFVARSDKRATDGFMNDPPCNEVERADFCTDAEIDLGILKLKFGFDWRVRG